MARGRKTAIKILLTPEERQTLDGFRRGRACPADLARHARLILLLADGTTFAETARLVGISRNNAYKWVQRWEEAGLEGLKNRHRGRKSWFPPASEKA